MKAELEFFKIPSAISDHKSGLAAGDSLIKRMGSHTKIFIQSSTAGQIAI